MIKRLTLVTLKIINYFLDNSLQTPYSTVTTLEAKNISTVNSVILNGNNNSIQNNIQTLNFPEKKHT